MIDCTRCGQTNASDARFCSRCGVALDGAPPAGEVRKTVTVMFMDAADSTGIGERTDPEAMRRVMSRYFDEIGAIVRRHGGVVEKYIGDAVMAVFGVPVVHEDDALRAVRAAAQIRARMSELSLELERERGLSIGWRTGINTGEVVAGDAGSGQRFVSGDAVNVAARLEQSAAAAEVLIGVETYRLVRDLVSVEPVTPISVKGKSEPIPAYRMTEIEPARHGITRRLDAPMVGRHRQQHLLAGAFDEAVAERVCHLFTILGAAGVGKSRLVAEFLSSLGNEIQVLSGRCLSYGEGITMWPIVEAIRQAAGLEELDDDSVVRAKIGTLVGDDRDRDMVVERIGGLFGRAAGGAAAEETYWAIRTLLQSLAARAPVILVLDDVHWAEEALLDLVEHLADWTRDTPLLLICLARQELLESRPGWGGGKQHATTLTLEPLSASETGELLENLLGQVDPGAGLSTRIAAASEGNPLFVEEMLGMLMDSGMLVHGEDGWVAVGDLGAFAVPPTIQALLAARLDSLSRPERAVLERGSVEGKVFHRSAVAELVPDNLRESVADQLRALSRKELVRPDRSDFAGDEAFRFRHLLIRDAAYSAMPKEARAQLHARFARWLTRMAGDHVGEYEEILGYHLEQAYRYRAELGPVDQDALGMAENAVAHLGRAGRRAADRGDARAAAKLLRSAIALMPVDQPERLRLVADLASAEFVSGNVREADSILVEALGQAEKAGDELAAARLAAVRINSRQTLAGVSTDEAIREAERTLEVFERHDDEAGIRRARVEIARQNFFAGRVRESLDQLVAILDGLPEDTPPPPALIGMLFSAAVWGPTPVPAAIEIINRVPISSRSIEAFRARALGGLHGLVGDFDAARRLLHEALDIERELGRVHMQDAVMGHLLGPMETLAGNYGEAERLMQQSYLSMTERGDVAFASTTAGNLAALYVAMGSIDEADRFADLTLSLASEDDVEARARGASAKGRVLAMRGELDAALEQARLAVALADGTDYVSTRGVTSRDLAEVLLAAGEVEEADESMRRALGYMEAKGATAYVEQLRGRLAEMASARSGS